MENNLKHFVMFARSYDKTSEVSESSVHLISSVYTQSSDLNLAVLSKFFDNNPNFLSKFSSSSQFIVVRIGLDLKLDSNNSVVTNSIYDVEAIEHGKSLIEFRLNIWG